MRETQRLIIRSFELEDAQDLLDIYGDEETMRFVGNGKPWLESKGAVAKVIVALIKSSQQEDGLGFFAIELKETKELIGHSGIKKIEASGDIEIGWVIKKAHWGLGYATEASVNTYNYAKIQLKINPLFAVICPANVPAIRVAKKLGFILREKRVVYGLEKLIFSD